MKTWGSGVLAPVSLTSALDEGEWLASRPCLFIAEETAPDTHFTGGWVDLRVSLDVMEKRKVSCPYRESNPDSLAIQSLYRLFWLLSGEN
jgi:hypothetical protein